MPLSQFQSRRTVLGAARGRWPMLAIVATVVAAPVFAQPSPIETGYWETQTAWLGLTGGADRWCIQPKDVSKFLSGPSNHIYHCVYPVSTAADGVIHFDGSCVDKHGQEIKLRGDGRYTPTSVHMTASGTAQLFGVPITGQASADAHLISSHCPPDAKTFR